MIARFFKTLPLVAVLGCMSVQADVSIELELGPLAGSSTALGVLVADTDGDGFAPFGPWMIGTTLIPGEGFGGDDDVIVAVFGTADSAPWPSDTGFSKLISGIDYGELGVSEGDDLKLFWLPGLDDTTTSISAGIDISAFRSGTPGVGASGSFIAPADGDSVSVSALSSALGGTFDSGNAESGIAGPAPIDFSESLPVNGGIPAGEVVFLKLEISRNQHADFEENHTGDIGVRLLDSKGGEIAVDLSDGVLQAGTYYIELTENSGTGPGGYDLAVNLEGYLPDFWSKYGRQRKGNNIYSAAPRANQTIKIFIRSRSSLRIKWYVENDASVPDDIGMRFSGRKSRDYRLKVTQSGRGNVTGEIHSGSYQTGELASNGRSVFTALIKPGSRAVAKRKSYKCRPLITSLSDPFARDMGQIEIKVRR